MAHYEDWFKALWNTCIDALDDVPDAEVLDPDHPLNGVLETMHAIADGEDEMWLAVPGGEPILNKYPDEPVVKAPWPPPAGM